MFAVIICTFYFVVFSSEAVTENGSASSFLKETHERIRINRAVKEPISNKSLNFEDSRKKLNSTENEPPILMKSFNSENRTEHKFPKSNLIDSAQLIMKSLNLTMTNNDEAKSTEKESEIPETSSKILLQKSNNNAKNSTEKESSTIIKIPNSQSTDNEEKESTGKKVLLKKGWNSEATKEGGNLTENDSLKVNLTDSELVEVKSTKSKQKKEGNTTGEKIQKEEGNSTAKRIQKEEGNSTAKRIQKEEGNSTAKKIQKEEGNLTEKKIQIEGGNSMEKKIQKEGGNSTEKEIQKEGGSSPEKKIQKGEGNSTEKKLANKNVTDSKQIISKVVNSERVKIEEGKLAEKEPNLKNLTGASEKSPVKSKNPKSRRDTFRSQLNAQKEDVVTKSFLTAYEKCKVLKDNHFVRVMEADVEETTGCVLKELKKLENHPNEFVQFLNNEEIIRA